MTPAQVESLFKEHARSVHAVVFRLTLDAAASDDATQEAFVRLLTSPPAAQTNLAAWLKRVAVNFAIDILRRQARVIALNDQDFALKPVSDQELGDELLAALRRLDADQRAAVLAVDRDGMSYEDAAQLTGLHLNKLRTDLARGRRALFEILKQERAAG